LHVEGGMIFLTFVYSLQLWEWWCEVYNSRLKLFQQLVPATWWWLAW